MMQALNTLTFPLQSAALIEASAGTGKTYTIANIYLRLVLGHQCEPLTVDKILVVTFTNAATAELKARIRQRLQQAYLDFYQQQSADGFIQSLIDVSTDKQIAVQRLLLASKQMDEASIFTIHGFCQRVLLQHAFESGSYYQQQLILDESEWLQLAVQDYWRKQIVPQSQQVLSVLLSIWSSPDMLQQALAGLLHKQMQILNQVSLDQCIVEISAFADALQSVKDYWLNNQVSQHLLEAELKANSKIAKAPLLGAVDAFCQSDSLIADFDKLGWALFSPEAISKARKKTSADLSAFDFVQFEILAEAQQQLVDKTTRAFLLDALTQVRSNLAANKQKQNLLSPDDLLKHLSQALNGIHASRLIQALQMSYPAVLIDEFQDTDPVQFGIFERIYASSLDDAHTQLCWTMIGDPKQAIYAFRGADIFTYIRAKTLLPHQRHFTLNTNWRSQAKLVDAVNTLFEASPNGFLLSDLIRYQAVEAANQPAALSLNQEQADALTFHQLAGEGKPISWLQAQNAMAQHFANQIVSLLAPSSHANLLNRQVNASDICVLVRDRQEAELIKFKLDQAKVPSVFLVRKSVFATQTAHDLFLILQALSHPQQETHFKAALLSELMCFDMPSLDALFDDEVRWQQSLMQLQQWHQAWCDKDLMLALQLCFKHFELINKLSSKFGDASRRLTDLRHLTELLQQQSQQMSGQSQLLSWFQQRLFEPDHNNESQQLRLDTDANLVQIITQHASKGLEFPIVFIPFASRYKASQHAIFHRDNALVADISKQPEHMQAAERERLAEDLRLLYVAITRAKYYCALGVWNNAHPQKRGQSEWFATAIGQLLAHTDEPASDASIARSISALNKLADIGHLWVDPEVVSHTLVSAQKVDKNHIAAELGRSVKRQWRLSSYSALSKHQQHTEAELPGLDEGREVEPEPLNAQELQVSPFSFARGAQAGSFLHAVLENIDFAQATTEILAHQILTQGEKYAIDEAYWPMLVDWLGDLLITPWQQQGGLSLANLAEYRVEMEFHLPVKQLDAKAFSELLNEYSPQLQRQYSFEQLTGMLKGYIDLTFSHDGKFYVADYKSNHLGNALTDYHVDKLNLAMQEHDYHLQAILYILALHKWLQSRLPDYRYQRHIGGAYYLFLRGMHSSAPANGVYHFLPPERLITQLEAMFAGKPTKSQPVMQGELF